MSQHTLPSLTTILQRIAAQHGLKHGWIDHARRTATPWIVACNGLTRTNLTAPGQFEQSLRERRDWCEQRAAGDYEIEPIGPSPENLTGQRFRFVDPKIAVAFKMLFPVDL